MKKFSDYFGLSQKVKFFEGSLGESKEEKLITIAKDNAFEYILNKYHIQPKIIAAKCHYKPHPEYPWDTKDLSGMVLITMKYQNKEFDVFISGQVLTKRGYDNYQYNHIKEDCSQYIEELIGTIPEICVFILKENFYIPNNMLLKKYEGNIEEFFNDIYVESVLCFVDYPHLERVRDISMIHKDNFHLLFLNLKADRWLRKFYEKAHQDCLRTLKHYKQIMARYSCFYEESYLIENGIEVYNKYDMKQCDDIYYMCFQEDKETVMTIDHQSSIQEFPEEMKSLLKEEVNAIEFGLTFYIESQTNQRVSIYLPPDRLEGELDVLHNEPAYFVMICKNQWNELRVEEIHEVEYIYGYYHLNIWSENCYLGMIKAKRK